MMLQAPLLGFEGQSDGFRSRSGPPDRCDWRLAAHDIRGLVSTFDMIADRCEGALEEPVRRQGQRLRRCTDRLADICAAVLGGTSCSASSADTVATILGDVASFAADHSRDGTRIRVTVAADAPCHASAGSLFRILYNLAINAVAAVNVVGGGEVHLGVFEAEGVLVFEVSDEGPGILAKTKARPFGKSAGSRHRPGLGLAIAERIADEIGAVLFLADTGPSGSTFRLVVKVADIARDHGR
jgi:signal transduction histidine kinase